MSKKQKRIRTAVALPIQPVDQFDLQFRLFAQSRTLSTDTIYLWDHSRHGLSRQIHARGKKVSYLFPQTESPHEFFGAIAYLSRLASKWHSVNLGILATDIWRRDPATLAQEINTIAYFTSKQIRLFVGAGEVMNIGHKDKPVLKLEQALPILNHCLYGPKEPIEDGQGGTIVMDLRAPKGREPLLGIAGGGSGNVMPRLAGEYAGAICPVMNGISPDDYRQIVLTTTRAAESAKRDPNNIEFGGQFYMVFANSQAEKDRLMNHPLIKYNALTFSAKTVKEHAGSEHPFGSKFKGYHALDPDDFDLDHAMNQVPDGLIEKVFLVGTVDEVFEQLKSYFEAGLTEVVSQTPAALISQKDGASQLRQLRRLHSKIKQYK